MSTKRRKTPEGIAVTCPQCTALFLVDAAKLLGSRGGKVGGRAKTEAKVIAAKANGRLGGRPRVFGSWRAAQAEADRLGRRIIGKVGDTRREILPSGEK